MTPGRLTGMHQTAFHILWYKHQNAPSHGMGLDLINSLLALVRHQELAFLQGWDTLLPLLEEKRKTNCSQLHLHHCSVVYSLFHWPSSVVLVGSLCFDV